MLIRKIICCLSLFAAMLILGWKMENLLISHTAVSQISSFSVEEFSFHTEGFTDTPPISVPYLPREYVRIRRTLR
ncbi:hypothetical protein [Paenibacillus sp. FSL R5-0912]|uniref:hypothetical protein n=1 Tax=Paenibacillus sp. FSL R5-0912 TaxID=1536771 RepID=UPI0012E0058F|nr:hypothetical protein [Paenibacillus sp. FSL R5-0912]